MARKLRAKSGRAARTRRESVVEPLLGPLVICQNAHRLLLRSRYGRRLPLRRQEAPAAMAATGLLTQPPRGLPALHTGSAGKAAMTG
jgi:hypothetical protein